jgi:signal transduction histidine kinase
MDGGHVICETVLAFYEDFEKRGLEPDVNFCEEELPIVANEVALRRVIQNIVKNALVHGVSRIGLTLEKKDDKLHFSCYNDKKPGEVIDVEQIFDRFYKGDKARTSTSTGLGLAIAKGLVERMKGTISAEVKDELFILDIFLPLSPKSASEKERIIEK